MRYNRIWQAPLAVFLVCGAVGVGAACFCTNAMAGKCCGNANADCGGCQVVQTTNPADGSVLFVSVDAGKVTYKTCAFTLAAKTCDGKSRRCYTVLPGTPTYKVTITLVPPFISGCKKQIGAVNAPYDLFRDMCVGKSVPFVGVDDECVNSSN